MRNKLIHLEGARGIASVVVLLHHFTLAFLPGLRAPPWLGGVRYTPLFALLNGEAAVAFFFVLSGFVLARGGLARPGWRPLAASVLKRLPRLMLPVSVTILAGWALLAGGVDAFRAAGALTGSRWLADFGSAGHPADFVPTLASALRQCVEVFFRADLAFYNSNLWTMRPEFLGSLAVFTLVGWSLLRPGLPGAAAGAHLVLLALFAVTSPYLAGFVLGSGLAVLLAEGRRLPALSGRAAAVLAGAALVLLSTENHLACLLAACVLMLLLLGHADSATRLSGRIGLWLGRLSFPLYLVHTLVILSAGSLVFTGLVERGTGQGAAIGAAFAATAVLSLLFALPLVRLDEAWVAWLNRAAREAVARLPSPRRRPGSAGLT